MKSVPVLRLVLRPSRLARNGLLLLCLLAVLVPWWSALSAPWCVAASMLVGVATLVRLRQMQTGQPTLLRLLPDGQWAIVWYGEERIARLLPGGHCSPWLLVLPLLVEDGSRTRLVLWTDSAAADDLRRLRCWLRWGARLDGAAAAADAHQA